jgi:hypothetical protein
VLLLLVPSVLIIGGNAFSYPKSSKVAMVPNVTCNNGGTLYTGTTWPGGDSFSFTNVAVADIENGNIADPITTGGYDTIVLMAMDFDFGAAWNDPVFSGRILSFINGGGRLIIYTSETTSKTAFSNFIYPFTVDAPGAKGSRSGSLTNLLNDTLSSTDPADVPPASPGAYINLAMITSQTDIGDLTVMTSYDPNWYIDLFGTNLNNIGGPAHTYAFYGQGLIIFNGLDLDGASGSPSNANGRAALEMLFWRELSSQSLGAGQNVNGLTLDPASAVNLVNTTHIVTATVRNTQTNNLTADVPVSFNITSGPNTGLTGQATTDTNGQATFNWSSSVVGTDILSATIPNSNPGDPNITSTATKMWVLPGNLSVNVTPSNWVMDVGQSNVFTASPNGGTLNYTSYQWYVNGSSVVGEVRSTFIFTPDPDDLGLYLISASVTDSNNTIAQSDNATVTVNAAPTISIEPVGPLNMNAGDTQLFIANYSGGTFPESFQWYVNNGAVGVNDTSYTYTADGNPGNVTCWLTDNASVPVTVISNIVFILPNPAGIPPTNPGNPPAASGPAGIYSIYLSILAPQRVGYTGPIPTEVLILTNGTDLTSWFNIKNGSSWVYPTNQTYLPPITLYDGSPDFFAAGNSSLTRAFIGTVTWDDVNGTKLDLIHKSAGNYTDIHHQFGNLDLSSKTVFHFGLYGSKSGCTVNMTFLAPNWSNFYSFLIKDNFTGSQDFFVPVACMNKTGVPSLSKVNDIVIIPHSPSVNSTFCIRSISMIDDLLPGFENGTYKFYVYASIKEGFIASSSEEFSVVPAAPSYTGNPWWEFWVAIGIIIIMIITVTGSIVSYNKFLNKKKTGIK